MWLQSPAEAGLLRGREAITCPLDDGIHIRFLAEHGAKVVDRDVVVSGRIINRIITSTGPATAFSVPFKLLEMLSGKDNVERVKKAMIFL